MARGGRALNRKTRFVAAGLFLVLVTACTPPDESRVGVVSGGNGQIEILAYICEGDQPVTLTLHREDTLAFVWQIDPREPVEYAEIAHILRVTPFEAPSGWMTSKDSLDHLRPDIAYVVTFSTIHGQMSSVEFRPEDIEQLGDLVWAGRTGHERAMTMEEFVENAERDCSR